MRILLTGASGQLGTYVLDQLVDSGHEVVAWSGVTAGSRRGIAFQQVDLTDLDNLGACFELAAPQAVIHAAAVSAADTVRRDEPRAQRINVKAVARLAELCRAHAARLVYTSTDMVFDGSRRWSREDDPTAACNAYGRTKRDGEGPVMGFPKGIVARLSLLYGPSRAGRPSYMDQALDDLRRGVARSFLEDEFRTPLDLATAAEALVGLALSDHAGVVHVGGLERLSRFDLTRRVALALGLDTALIGANRRSDLDSPEPRPADLSLDTRRLSAWLPALRRPKVEEAVARWNQGFLDPFGLKTPKI